MELKLDWSAEFQEFQEVLNSGIDPYWLYAVKRNLILEPCYTGQGKQYFRTEDILKASESVPFF
ncbi:hypothetical protein K0017_06270 [Staphylococcus massiliensis]|uniref:hypothetical protein n=1 Tax=Staphylococcus massiliensis TaxID=555791 RepID=UPI001EDD6E71|nr:hypothetical protein [Staphylococcus massiliensis]MCG3401924.1 hypothetical protein [Staphylococcus massiliensis]